jgi:hypothetical protein
MDFNRWIMTLQSKLIKNVPDLSKMKSTMAMSIGKSMKKSRKVVFDD